MSERDTLPQNATAGQPDAEERGGRRGGDDRRAQVNPVDKPFPRSPEPERDAVREGEEKLRRVKPY